MFNLFKKDPVSELQAQYEELTNAAMLKQRNGDMHAYAELTEKAEAIGEQIDELQTT